MMHFPMNPSAYTSISYLVAVARVHVYAFSHPQVPNAHLQNWQLEEGRSVSKDQEAV